MIGNSELAKVKNIDKYICVENSVNEMKLFLVEYFQLLTIHMITFFRSIWIMELSYDPNRLIEKERGRKTPRKWRKKPR